DAAAVSLEGPSAGNDGGTGSSVTRSPQPVVNNTCRRRERVADFTDADANSRAFNHSIGQGAMLVEVQTFDTHIPCRLWAEAPDKAGSVQADALQSESQPKPVAGRGHRVIGCVLGSNGSQC